MNSDYPKDWQEPVDVHDKNGVWAEEHPAPLEERIKKFAVKALLRTTLTLVRYGRHIPYCTIRYFYALHGYDNLFEGTRKAVLESSDELHRSGIGVQDYRAKD